MQNKRYWALAALVGSLCLGGCESTAPEEDSAATVKLGEFDLNGDGFLTADEWEDTGGGTKTFEEADANADGNIGEDELAAVMGGMAEGQIFIPAPLVCEVGVAGILTTPTGDVSLDGATVEASSVHLGSGCLTSLEFTLSWGDGCELSAAASVVDAQWQMESASVSDGCADLADFAGLVFNEGASTFALVSGPSAEATEEEECVAGADVNMVGRLLFGTTADAPAIALSGVKLNGNIFSSLWEDTSGAAGGSCGTVPETCVEQGCGTDSYGVACGVCEDSFTCVEGSCQVWNCPPEAPFGTLVGDIVLPLEYQDCDGNWHSLHDLCGQPAGLFNLLAGY